MNEITEISIKLGYIYDERKNKNAHSKINTQPDADRYWFKFGSLGQRYTRPPMDASEAWGK